MGKMCDSIDEIKVVTEELEKIILEERKQFEKGDKSSFSYWLYELRIKNYRNEECETITNETLKQRLLDIIKQCYINMEDYPLDQAVHFRAKEHILKAKKWLDALH